MRSVPFSMVPMSRRYTLAPGPGRIGVSSISGRFAPSAALVLAMRLICPVHMLPEGITRLDLLSCRNVLIYLEPELQDRILQTFHYALNALGVLFLSSSESIGTLSELFAPLNRKWKLYRAIHSITSTRAVMSSRLS